MIFSLKYTIILLLFVFLANAMAEDATESTNILCQEQIGDLTSSTAAELGDDIAQIAPSSCLNSLSFSERCKCLSDLEYKLDKEEQRELAKKLHRQYLGYHLKEKMNDINEKYFYYKKLYSIFELELPTCKINRDDRFRLSEIMPDNHRRENLRNVSGNLFKSTRSFSQNFRGLNNSKVIFNSELREDSLIAFLSKVLVLSIEDGVIDTGNVEDVYEENIDEFIYTYTSIKKVNEERLREDVFQLFNLLGMALREADIEAEEMPTDYDQLKELVKTTFNSFLTAGFDNYEQSCLSLQEDVKDTVKYIDAPVYHLKNIPFDSLSGSLISDEYLEGTGRNRPRINFLLCEGLKKYIPDVFDDYDQAFERTLSIRSDFEIIYDGEILKIYPEKTEEGMDLPFDKSFIDERVSRESFISQSQRVELNFIDMEDPLDTSTPTSAVYDNMDKPTMVRINREPINGEKPTKFQTARTKILDTVTNIVNRVDTPRKVVSIKELGTKASDKSSKSTSNKKKGIKEVIENVEENKYKLDLAKSPNLYNYFSNSGITSLSNFYKFDYKDPYSISSSPKVASTRNIPIGRDSSPRRTKVRKLKDNSNKRIPDSIKKYNDLNDIDYSYLDGTKKRKRSNYSISEFAKYRPRFNSEGKVTQGSFAENKTNEFNVIAPKEEGKKSLANQSGTISKSDASNVASTSSSGTSATSINPTGVMATSDSSREDSPSERPSNEVSSIETTSNPKEKINAYISKNFLMEREFKEIEDHKLNDYKTSDNLVYVFIEREVKHIKIKYLQTYRVDYVDGKYYKKLLSTESLYRVEMTPSKIRVINDFFDLKRKGVIL